MVTIIIRDTLNNYYRWWYFCATPLKIAEYYARKLSLLLLLLLFGGIDVYTFKTVDWNSISDHLKWTFPGKRLSPENDRIIWYGTRKIENNTSDVLNVYSCCAAHSCRIITGWGTPCAINHVKWIVRKT